MRPEMAAAIMQEGGSPVFIDNDGWTWNMDPEVLERAFGMYPDVKIVIVSNTNGIPGNLKDIVEFQRRTLYTIISLFLSGLIKNFTLRSCCYNYSPLFTCNPSKGKICMHDFLVSHRTSALDDVVIKENLKKSEGLFSKTTAGTERACDVRSCEIDSSIDTVF